MYKEFVLQELFQLQDLQYQKFHSSLVPGTNNIIGVRVPALRKLANSIIKNNWQDYLDETLGLQDQYYEETIIQGLVIATAKMTSEKRITLINSYIPKINNWAQCDIFCTTLKEAKKYPDQYWQIVTKYCTTNSTYDLRFGIVMLLTYYTSDSYATKALEILKSIKHNDYYVKMAIAWAISIFYIKQTELTLTIIKENSLDRFTHNKAIQKICESFRVSPENKKYIRMLKR